MYGKYLLCGISKVPPEIPHKISYLYIERCAYYSDVNIQEIFKSLKRSWEFRWLPADDLALMGGGSLPGTVTFRSEWCHTISRNSYVKVFSMEAMVLVKIACHNFQPPRADLTIKPANSNSLLLIHRDQQSIIMVNSSFLDIG